MDIEQLVEALAKGECLAVDLRSDGQFQDGHIPGSSLATYYPQGEAAWLDTVAPWQQGHGYPLVLVGQSESVMLRLRGLLEERGIAVLAVLEHAIEDWLAKGYDLARIGRLTASTLAEQLDHWRVIDVREPHEWQEGIIPGAILMSLGSIPRRADELDPELSYAVICAHGHRSRLASNWLADHGFQVADVEGGMAEWSGPISSPR